MVNNSRLRLLRCILEIAHTPRNSNFVKFYQFATRRPTLRVTRRSFYASACRAEVVSHEGQVNNFVGQHLDLLPKTCPGCGALTHNDATNKAGYYGRRSIKNDIRQILEGHVSSARSAKDQDDLTLDETESTDLVQQESSGAAERLSQALCERCHDLSKESQGNSISHPSIDSIAAIIDESPYQHNHVYHILDAADFPASLIPNIFEELSLVHQRSQNRRAKSTMYKGGHRTTVSFIITRSDILLPSQAQIDRLMPWFIRTLRTALGWDNENARMGNVHLVSSKRGWWTKEIKEDIRQRGGANWMVGKVNVGKSNLFQVLYPKGGREVEPDFALLREEAMNESEDISSVLMPPSQPLVPYPALPLVSSLPGTTASPIRLPFVGANGKRGELIDLPGLFRSPLERFILPEHQASLVMTKRPKPESISIRPHQSLLIGGGLIRITPYIPDSNASDASVPVIIAHAFLPPRVPTHLTSTIKAVQIQSGTLTSGIPSIISTPSSSPSDPVDISPSTSEPPETQTTLPISSAGKFTLSKDLTSLYASKLLKNNNKTIRVQDLPFRVMATDIIIEGIGWIELTSQVRIPRGSGASDSSTLSPPTVTVEIFSPGGKGVMARECAGISGIVALNEGRKGKKHRPRMVPKRFRRE